MIFSQDIISSYRICIVDHHIYDVDASFFSILFLCIFDRHFFRLRRALTGIALFLPDQTDPFHFEFVFQLHIDPCIWQAMKLLICSSSQVVLFSNPFDITDHDRMDLIFYTIIRDIPCQLMNIILDTVIFLLVNHLQMI